VGRFSALGPTVLAGLGIGMFQSETAELRANFTWFPSTGVTEAFVFALIIVFLTMRGDALPRRGALLRQQFPRSATPRHVGIWILGGGAVLVTLFLFLGSQYRAALITSLIMAILALSSVIITGFVGQISLAQLALAGIGGFILSRLTTRW